MSTKNNPSKLHPELLKIYNSPIYRRKIKRMIETTKSLRNIMWGDKIPHRAKFTKRNPTDKEREEFSKKFAYQLDKECLHYFAQSNEFSQERRTSSYSRNQSEE